MEYLVKLDLFAWQVAQNQSENNNGVYGDEKWAACLFHTDRVVREAIASGAVQPVEMTMGYHVNLTDPGAVIKLSELAAYGKAKGFWWGDLPTMAKSLGFNAEPEVLPELEQEAAAPAPLVLTSDGPAPLTTGDIAHCFDGLHWSESAWKKPLGDRPKWLAACVAIPGHRGVTQTHWNPVSIGAALAHQGHATARTVRARFQTTALLMPWLEAWKTYEADYLDKT